jgi:hypothetical protein
VGIGGGGTFTNVRFVGNLIGQSSNCPSLSGVTYAYNVSANANGSSGNSSCGGGPVISGDPFVDFATNNFALTGSASPPADYVPCGSGDEQLSTDINGNARPSSGSANCSAGAYETVSSNPSSLVGDLNGDGTVNAADLAILVAAWGTTNQAIATNLNNAGPVGPVDLSILLSHYGSN